MPLIDPPQDPTAATWADIKNAMESAMTEGKAARVTSRSAFARIAADKTIIRDARELERLAAENYDQWEQLIRRKLLQSL